MSAKANNVLVITDKELFERLEKQFQGIFESKVDAFLNKLTETDPLAKYPLQMSTAQCAEAIGRCEKDFLQKAKMKGLQRSEENSRKWYREDFRKVFFGSRIESYKKALLSAAQ